MKFSVSLPVSEIQFGNEFIGLEALTELAQAAEAAGFHGCSVTDHPCPTGRWLDHGGHFAQDPFVMLSAVATVTKRIRLHTNILILPYRNPFVVARAISSLDVLSGGRFTLGGGAGYLKGEFKAVGADFDTRNERMDEVITALKLAFTQDEFSMEGSDFSARECRILPRPLQRPHPPIWIGGNSKRAIRRAVELGDGWLPFDVPADVATTSRTAALGGEEGLKERLAYLRNHASEIGRTAPLDIVLIRPHAVTDLSAFRREMADARELGVTWMGVSFPGETRRDWCANVRRFGAEILAGGTASA